MMDGRKSVAFRHPRPANTSEHQRLFGREPFFSADVSALEWDRSALEWEVPGTDPALSRILERHAQALLAEKPELGQAYADRVRTVLASALAGGTTTLESVATRLAMSARTLQRRLTSEGVTFDGLPDAVRLQLAVRYLTEPKVAISEVAYLLGYSEPSPFHRAFRRWTGTTPSEFRRTVV